VLPETTKLLMVPTTTQVVVEGHDTPLREQEL
jgi:hypothetical protein